MYEKVENILKTADESNTSVIAFICMDNIMVQAVVAAAAKTNTPAIVMLYPEHVSVQRTCTKRGYAAALKELAGSVNVPIGLHIDHDFSLNNIINSIESGFDSAMIDGSMHSLEKNIALTKEVVKRAHSMGAVIEGEIGHVGPASETQNKESDLYTKPEAAERFCRETGVDTLAVSIGNAHGEYKEKPHLDIRRLEEIKSAVNVPLVLHGGSGIPDDQLLTAFSKGIRKFNLGTDYLSRYYDAISGFVNENKGNADPVKVIDLPEYAVSILQPYLEERMSTLCKF